MTLGYQSLQPPPPGRSWLVAFGVVTVVLASFMLLGGICTSMFTLAMAPRAGTVLAAATMPSPATAPAGAVQVNTAVVTYSTTGASVTSMPAGGMPSFNRQTLLMSAILTGVSSVVFGGVMAWFGVAMLRVRRWVRAWVVALSGIASLTMFASIPSVVVVALGTTMPGGAPVWAIWFGVGFVAIFEFGLPLAYFLYFVRQGTESLFRHYSPEPTWTDRWPLGPFAVMVGAALASIAGLFGAVMLLGRWSLEMEEGSRAILLLAGLAQSAAFAALAALCFRRSRLAWPAAWAAIALQAAFAAYAVVAGVKISMTGIPGASQGQMVPQPTLANLLVPAAYACALWACRGSFAQMSEPPPEMAAAVPPPLPPAAA